MQVAQWQSTHFLSLFSKLGLAVPVIATVFDFLTAQMRSTWDPVIGNAVFEAQAGLFPTFLPLRIYP
jgi:hypothetical protein